METDRHILAVCSCEDTMPLDMAVLGQRGATVKTARHLCRSQLDAFKAMLGEAGVTPITVGCTQEAPLFQEVAQELGHVGALHFANIRETAGWSDQAKLVGPKMAALLAAAAEPMPPTAFTTLKSEGVALIYGHDQIAVEVAQRLSEHLDVTVILSRPKDITPLRVASFPVLQGTIGAVKGHLGDFTITVNDFAAPSPASRGALSFGMSRDGATSHCDILIDLSGGAPLVAAGTLRPGYLKADPSDGAAIEKLIGEASHLTGEFDKPRYVTLKDELCAHSRSKKIGCTRCLDLCPVGAITPNGDHVAVSAEICAGCGACASVCPTGAITYALPPADALLRRVRTLLTTYAKAGGKAPVLLIHDGDHGEPLIDALARFGNGLPAHVLPLRVNEVTQAGLDLPAAALAYGANAIRYLIPARAKHDLGGLIRNIDYANMLADALGYGETRAGLIETDDPDMLRAALDAVTKGVATPKPATFLALGAGRGLIKQSVEELFAAAPVPQQIVAMPPHAPFGKIDVNAEGCTLCLACVSACPVSALTDNADKPMLRFQEDLCVQCGLCAATCPEKVITLTPQIDLVAWAAGPKVMKEEEPFHCINCAKPFGVKSTVERIVAKLENKHWMFSGAQSNRISVIKMCEDCRVEVVVNESFDPHASPPRPNPRTAEDYIREAKERGEDPLQ
jgi:ferredoxin